MDDNDRDNFRNIDNRLASVERDITSLAASFESVTNAVSRIERAHLQLSDSVNIRGRTNWGVVATMAGVGAAVLVFYTNLVTSPIAISQGQIRDNLRREIELVSEQAQSRTSDTIHRVEIVERELARRGGELWTRDDNRAFRNELNDRFSRIENWTLNLQNSPE